MKYKTKRALKKTAKAGANAIYSAIALALRTVGILLLIFITTGAIFASIFAVYIKTNLASEDLGVSLEEYQLNETSIIYYYDKTTDSWVESASIFSEDGFMYWVPYDEIPKDMEHALVAIEDQRFYKHHGVDWARTANAFLHMFLGNSTFGGSTITQQLRKNVTGENENTVRRKLTEIFAALQLEKEYDKWEIIEWYLNVVNFGHGESRGIGDAARYYFDKEVKDLSLAEICCIVGITNNPSLYNPYYHPQANKKRQETILYEMYRQGYIDKEQYETAKAEELHFVNGDTEGQTDAIYSWFDETVRQDVAEYLAEQRGVTVKAAKTLLATGGFKIYSTMDPEVQAKVDQYYGNREYIDSLKAKGDGSQQFQSAVVVTDPYTGNSVALAGQAGEKTGNLWLNMATETRRPPGSSIKPIAVYAPAMDYGLITPDTLIDDGATELKGKPGWMPRNDDNQTHGIVTIRRGLSKSYNRVSAQVLDMLTPASSYAFLTEKLHMELDPRDMDYAPLCLGQLTYGATVREMAQAFGIFPNEGQFIETRTFTQIYDSEWNLIYENVPETEGVISPVTAYWMTDMLKDAPTIGTISIKVTTKEGRMPFGGKTGTTDSKKDRWFVGFTPYYVAAIWTGYPYPKPITVKGNPAATIFAALMSSIHEDLPIKDFSVPANTYQPPVPGVEPMSYYARGIAVNAYGGVNILYENEAGTSTVGREVTVTAPEVEGYILTGPATVTLTVSQEPEDNVAEFYYTPVAPPPDTSPDTSTDTTDSTPPETTPPETTPPETAPPETDAPDTSPEE